jgi:hypothetical protein
VRTADYGISDPGALHIGQCSFTSGVALAACGGAAAPSSADRATLRALQKSVLAAFRQGPTLVTWNTFRVRCQVGDRPDVYVCDVAQTGLGTTTDHFYNVRLSPPSARCWTAQDRDVPQYRLDGCLAGSAPNAGGRTTSTANG